MAAAKKKTKRPAGAKKPAAAPQSAAAAVSLNAALAEAAWAEADAALAQALADLDEAQNAATPAQRREALEMLAQSLAQAGRRRGLARTGELGARERFDAHLHELSAPAVRAPKTVRVIARGVTRAGELLVRPRVRADAGAKKRKPKKAAKKASKSTAKKTRA